MALFLQKELAHIHVNIRSGMLCVFEKISVMIDAILLRKPDPVTLMKGEKIDTFNS